MSVCAAALLIVGARVGAHPLPHDAGPCGSTQECQVIWQLFQYHNKVTRNKTLTPFGYTAITTSKDPHIASLLQQHVWSMHRRVEEMRPMNTWDPLFAALFNNSKNIDIEVKNVTGGVAVSESAKLACPKAIAVEHSGVVDRFVSIGMAEMQGPAHPVPKVCPFSNATNDDDDDWWDDWDDTVAAEDESAGEQSKDGGGGPRRDNRHHHHGHADGNSTHGSHGDTHAHGHRNNDK